MQQGTRGELVFEVFLHLPLLVLKSSVNSPLLILLTLALTNLPHLFSSNNNRVAMVLSSLQIRTGNNLLVRECRWPAPAPPAPRAGTPPPPPAPPGQPPAAEERGGPPLPPAVIAPKAPGPPPGVQAPLPRSAAAAAAPRGASTRSSTARALEKINDCGSRAATKHHPFSTTATKCRNNHFRKQ